MSYSSKSTDLPQGWEEKRTPEGKPYYIDYNTKTTHWKLPNSVPQSTYVPTYASSPKSVHTPPGSPSLYESTEELPSGWGKKFTAEGKPYYIDYNTKTTHWKLPDCVPQSTYVPTYASTSKSGSNPSLNRSQSVHTPPGSPSLYESAEELPSGWEKKFTAEGKPYYMDYNTKTTHWKLPDSPGDSPTISSKTVAKRLSTKTSSTPNLPISPSNKKGSFRKSKLLSKKSSRKNVKSISYEQVEELPEGWERKFTAEGKIYYVDNSTKTTHWHLPGAIPDIPDKLSDVQNCLLQGDITMAKELCNIYGTEELDINGKTLLHYVSLGTKKFNCEQNLLAFVDIATYLKDSGVDVNAQDANGNTAFHLAVGDCPPDLIYWFISYGEILQNKEEKTPIMLAEESIMAGKGVKDDKKKLKRADGVLYLFGKDGWLNFKVPKNFYCPTRFSLRTALMMALLAKLIYKGDGVDLDEEQSPGNILVRSILKRWGFSSIKIFEKSDARALVVEKEATEDMPHVHVIAFRGTKTKKDILTDLSANKRGGGTTHSGFQTHLNRIADAIGQQIDPNGTSPIFVTGHSLGGAMATLMMKKLHTLGFSPDRLHMYTFGQPRAGTVIFQSEFDSLFKDAYFIQRNLDPVPLVPTFSGLVVGGYVHSGSLRYLDSAGQLYNDLHYQYEDINRAMLHSLPKDKIPTPQEFRTMWTGGLQQLNQHVSISENKTNLEELGLVESDDTPADESSGYIPQKALKKKDTNVVFNMIKGRKEALLAHGMLGYLTDIALLESRINQPFSWEDPENAITSQLSEVTLPLDSYREDIKGDRYKLEQEAAYQHWIKYYIKLPGFQNYNLDSSISCEEIIPWIHQDGKVLQQISLIEGSILSKNPDLDQNTEIPKLIPKREDVSPLVEVGMYSVINLLSQMMKENEDLGMTYYRWLYWSMPESGYYLKSTDESEAFTLERGESPYRVGIQSCMKRLSTKDSSLEELGLSLPAIAKADNGPFIAKVSVSIQNMQEKCIELRKEARVELSNLEYAIVGEMIAKFKKVGLKAGAYCAASGCVGAAAGIATGLAVFSVTGGVATPAAIIAGVAVGAGTTGTLIGVAAAKKIPKYMESLRTSLIAYEQHLLAIAEANTDKDRTKHKAAILKLCKAHQSRSRVVLHMLNGLYITLALAKIQSESILSPSGGSGTFIERQQETFFRKVLSLINLYVAVVKFDDSHVNSHLEILSKICRAIETNPEVFKELFATMGQELAVKRSTIGPDIYMKRATVNQSLLTLTDMITDQMHPDHQKMMLTDSALPDDTTFKIPDEPKPIVPTKPSPQELNNEPEVSNSSWTPVPSKPRGESPVENRGLAPRGLAPRGIAPRGLGRGQRGASPRGFRGRGQSTRGATNNVSPKRDLPSTQEKLPPKPQIPPKITPVGTNPPTAPPKPQLPLKVSRNLPSAPPKPQIPPKTTPVGTNPPTAPPKPQLPPKPQF